MENFTLCMTLIQLHPLLCWTYGAWTSDNAFLFPPTPELVYQFPFKFIYRIVSSLAQRTGGMNSNGTVPGLSIPG